MGEKDSMEQPTTSCPLHGRAECGMCDYTGRAALNHKFEYERAKRLNAQERFELNAYRKQAEIQRDAAASEHYHQMRMAQNVAFPSPTIADMQRAMNANLHARPVSREAEEVVSRKAPIIRGPYGRNYRVPALAQTVLKLTFRILLVVCMAAILLAVFV